VIGTLAMAEGSVANFSSKHAIPNVVFGLSRQRIELLRWTHFAPRQQLALPDHVHEFDAGERDGG
jgi:hypothetical protein